MDDETNMSSLRRSSINPPLGVVAPDTIPSNPPKAERWVPYRNPQAQERAEDEPSAASPSSDTNETNENSVQPDETTSSIPADLVEVTKRYAKRYAALSQSEEDRGWHWNLAPDGSFAMSTKTKKQKRRPKSKSARHRCNPPRRAPTACYKGSSNEEDLLASDEEVSAPLRNHADKTPMVVGATRQASVASSPALQRKRKRQKIEDGSSTINAAESADDDSEYEDSECEDDFECCESEYEDRDSAWMVMYHQLLSYKEQHGGSTNVPRGYCRNKKLAKWVANQRQLYHGNMKALSKERIDLLESIGFQWRLRCRTWMEMYKRLEKYKQGHNSTCVPISYKADPQLGRWVQWQRQHCKMKERIALLESIGFQWRLKEKRPWMEMYKRLEEYKQEYNSTCVPHKYKADPQLGIWVVNQRQKCKKKERVDLLNKIGFVWKGKIHRFSPDDRLWMEMYKRLEDYKQEHNSTCVPSRYKADPQLAKWVVNQRHRCKNKERVDLLNKIGFVWKVGDTDDRSWMGMYKRLEEYKLKYNSTCVPCKYKADPQLANWVSYQRQKCKKKELVDLLNKIGFVWKPKWRNQYST